MRKILAAIIAFSIVMASVGVCAEERKIHDATCFLSTAEPIKDGTVQDLTVYGKTKYPGAKVTIQFQKLESEKYTDETFTVISDKDKNYSCTIKDFDFKSSYSENFKSLYITVSSNDAESLSENIDDYTFRKTIDFKEDEIESGPIHKILNLYQENHTCSASILNPATDVWGESRYPYAKIEISYLACDGSNKTLITTAREDGMFFAFLPDLYYEISGGQSEDEFIVIASSDDTNEKCVKAKESEPYKFKGGFPFPSSGSGSILKFAKKKVKINKGKKITLKLKARNLSGTRVRYSVNKKRVVKLSKKKNTGVVVKGLRKGKAIIKAKARGKITKCTVVVK